MPASERTSQQERLATVQRHLSTIMALLGSELDVSAETIEGKPMPLVTGDVSCRHCPPHAIPCGHICAGVQTTDSVAFDKCVHTMVTEVRC